MPTMSCTGAEGGLDATTMLSFRWLLCDNKLGVVLLARFGNALQAKCFRVNTGTMVLATL